MATQKIKTTIIPRKDTYANWTASTAKVLAAGEFGLDTTNNVLKCGDGTNTWANLPELNETTLSDLGITATAAEINKLDGLTATTAELNYVDGVTSAIQTQLDKKAPKSHASSGTTYGVATTSNYGHVKISNGDVATVSSANGLAAGMDHSHSNYVNQNAFSNVKVGSTTVSADTTTDTLELVAGTNVTITPDATNDKITISATDTVYTHPSTHAASMITGLATVATSGSYNDLSNKPTIPTVNNGTLTIQGNGTAASTFTANQSGNTTLNIKGSGGTTVTKSANNEITISTGTIPTGAAASKGVDTSISAASTSTNLPTSKAVAAFVEGKGYKTTDYNQTIKSGTTTFGVNDAVEIVAGTNVTVTPDATNKKITISSTNTTYSDATTSASGLMSSSDKTKLNGIATGANKYIHPAGTGSSKASGLYKFSTDSGSHISGVTEVTKDDITALGIPAQDTTYSAATTSANGLMTSTDKSKLDGIASGATKVTTDTVSGWGYTKNAGTVTSVKVGSTSYNPSSGVVSLPAYPTVPSSLKNPNKLNLKVNSETTNFVEYDGSAAKTLTIKPSTTAGAFIVSDGTTDKTIQLAGKFTDTNTDTKVTQTQVSSSDYNKNYPLLMASSDVATIISKTGSVYKNYNNLYANPYSGQLTATSVVTSNKVQIYDGDYESGVTLGVGFNGWDEEGTISIKNVDSEVVLTGSGKIDWTDSDGNNYEIDLPSDNGTLALTSDIPTSIAWTSVTGKPSTFTPPTATSSVLGGVKTSTGITNSSGTISVAYGTTAGTACQGNDSRLSDSRTPKAHNQASNTINAMTGYTKASAASAISTSDSLNTAIGKLEKALDGKGTSNLTLGTTSTTAAKGNHTHDYSSTYAAKSHTHDYLSTSGGTLTNSSSGNAVLTIANGSYLPKLTFSASGGGHNPTISLAPYASGSTSDSFTVYLPAKNGTLATTDDLSNRAVLFSENKGSGGIMVSATQNSIESSDYTIGTGETFSDATKNEIPTKGAISSYLGNNFAPKSHTHSSYANQNAFSNVKVVKSGGGTSDVTVAADTTTDTISFEGNNITITGDATNDKVTFGLTKTNVTTALGYTPPTKDTTYSEATTSAAGLMSAADKTKLNGIATGATANKGTVTSVRVQAGTGLSSSVSTAQTGSLNTTISIASGYKLPTSTEWSDVMKKSGNETAMGLKTFYDGITFGTWDGTLGGDGFGGELIYSPVGSIILVEEGSDSTLIGVTTDSKLALTNLTAPTKDSDAATKYYVDQTVDDAKPSIVGANGTTGLIKNGSSVTSTSGLTACPIISGVPYYKDTNTQSAYGNVTTSGTITAAAVKTASGVVVVDSSNKIQKVTSMSDFRTIIGAGTSNLAIGTGASNAAAGNHTHKYAGSSSAGGAANSVKTNLIIKLNGGSVEDTSLFTFNGSAAKTINITPAAIGALSVYNADDSDTWDTTTTSKLPTKRSVAAYTAATFAEKGHKHTASLATDTGTSAITLSHGGKYKLTAGGSSVIFTMPSATYLATKLGASAGLAGGSSEGDYTGYLPILKNAPSSTSENSVCYLASGMSSYAGATKMAFGDMIGNIGGVRLGDSSSLSNNVWVSGFVLNQTPTNAMQHMPLAMWSDPTNTYSAGLGLTSSGVINLRTTGQQILVRNSESNVLDPNSYDGYTFTFPSKNGTIALTSDIPTFKTINGNTITGSGNITITADVPSDIECANLEVNNDITIAGGGLTIYSDETDGVSNSPFGSNNDADIDAFYYSKGIKVDNNRDSSSYELAFPARSGVLSLKGHTHSVSAIKSINYSSYSKSATIASNRDTYQSSYCSNSYWQTKIYGDIQSIGPSTGTVFRVVVYSETNAILSNKEITGRDLHFFIPGFDVMIQSGAPGYPISIILFEKFNDTDYYVLGQIVRNANSNSSTRVSRVLVEYSDPDDSGVLTIFEVGQMKTSSSSITSGGSSY